MRSIWSGNISFGLVNIPIKLYSATERDEISFDLLHKKDNSPIRYARICRKDGQEVPWEEVVKGYEYEDGDYVVLADEDFKKADLRKTKSIDVLDFVKEDEIESEYFEKPYYLEPAKGAAKSYALLREALKKSKKVGIAKFVIRNREHLGIVKPEGDVIVLNQMRFEKELRKYKELDLPKATEVQNREIEMALSFIDQLTTHFDPKKYKDEYVEKVEDIIEQKAKGRVPRPKGEEPQPTQVRDLMGLLRESLERERNRQPLHA